MNFWYQLCICSLACGGIIIFSPHSALAGTKQRFKNAAKDAMHIAQHLATTNWFSKKTLRYIRHCALTPLIGENFGRVGDKLYRSSQPSRKQLMRYLAHYPIATSINLRDNARGKRWWRKEQQAVLAYNRKFPAHHVRLINVPLSARRLPEPTVLKKLLAIFHNKSLHPLHINCHFGRDRTGLACALYVLEVQKGCLGKALKQFDFLTYGHIEKHMPNMKKFIKKWYDIRSPQHFSSDKQALTQALQAYEQWYQQETCTTKK